MTRKGLIRRKTKQLTEQQTNQTFAGKKLIFFKGKIIISSETVYTQN